MRAIANGNNDAQWDNKLLKDLGFIKKKLRYPLNAKTLTPVLLVAFITAIIGLFLLSSHFYDKEHKTKYQVVLAFSIIFIPFFVSLVRYIQSLKFVSIPTQFFATKNMALLENFLKAQQLAVFHHPEAPEVFQIISKAIDQYKDQREVMIFIADDKRILINSHFTNQGFSLVATALHRKDMGNTLKSWISANADKYTRQGSFETLN